MLRSISEEIIIKLNDIYKVYPVMYMYVDYSLNGVLLIKAYNALESPFNYYYATSMPIEHKIILEYNK